MSPVTATALQGAVTGNFRLVGPLQAPDPKSLCQLYGGGGGQYSSSRGKEGNN